MPSFIPHFIAKQQRAGQNRGTMQAASLFVDIAGFTAMTQSLMKNGREGAEILSAIINRLFTPAIGHIHGAGGFVATFAGDAFTALFPVEDHEAGRALAAARRIQQLFQEQGRQATRFGEFPLSAKLGLSFGVVDWGIIGQDAQRAFYFRGPAINGAVQSEHRCGPGEVVIDDMLMKRLPGLSALRDLTEGFHVVEGACPTLVETAENPVIAEDEQRGFVPAAVLSMRASGEFRDVAGCFISFEPGPDWEGFVGRVMALTDEYGGYFNKVDFGDKGGIILVLFGAPVEHERLFDHAGGFALEVVGLDRAARIGLTFGTVYAGLVGSRERCEYTALGAVVNLASRLVMSAKPGEILVDTAAQAGLAAHFQTAHRGDIALKGFEAPVPGHALLLRREQANESVSSGKLVGRLAELQQLRSLIEPIDQGRFAGIVYVDGLPGIGKSRLVAELRSGLDPLRHHWLHLPCDEVLRKGFNPVIYFLKGFFQQAEAAPDNQARFERLYEVLSESTEDPEIRRQLSRTKSFTGALLNLHWEGSLHEQLDPRARYENTLDALKSLFKALCRQRPAVIEIEDGQWIDSDTRNFLESLTRNIEDVPLVVLSACRTLDDGSPFGFGLAGVSENRLTLQFLDRGMSRSLVESLLREHREIPEGAEVPLSEAAFELVWSESEGNPFYLEQIVLYLLENNLLDRQHRLVDGEFEIPKTVNLVIIARVDRLSADLKDVIKTASVLGREFAVRVLSAMLADRPMEQPLQQGEQEAIWSRLSQLKCLFRHALIRESVYRMQLLGQLRGLHRLAAEAIEAVYGDGLAEFYRDLAEHYQKAEVVEKAREYLRKAADQARDRFQNQSALDLYGRLLEYTADSRQRIGIDLSRGDIMRITGSYGEAEALYRRLLDAARPLGDNRLLIDILCRLCDTLEVRYAHEELAVFSQEAHDLCRATDDRYRLAPVLNHRTWLLFQQARMSECHACLQEILAVAEASDDIYSQVTALFSLKNTVPENGMEGLLDRLRGCLDRAAERNDKHLQAKILFYLGDILMNRGRFDEAIGFNRRMQALVDEIGDKRGQCYAIGDMGIILDMQGKYREAIGYYQRKIRIAEEMGDIYNIYEVLENMGSSYYNLGEYQPAEELYDRAIEITRQHEMWPNLCYSLFLKAKLCFVTGRIDQAASFNHEAMELAGKVKRHFVSLQGSILEAKITARTDRRAGIDRLLALRDEYPDGPDAAPVLLELYRLSGDEDHRREALELHRSLYREMPLWEYEKAIGELTRPGDAEPV